MKTPNNTMNVASYAVPLTAIMILLLIFGYLLSHPLPAKPQTYKAPDIIIDAPEPVASQKPKPNRELATDFKDYFTSAYYPVDRKQGPALFFDAVDSSDYYRGAKFHELVVVVDDPRWLKLRNTPDAMCGNLADSFLRNVHTSWEEFDNPGGSFFDVTVRIESPAGILRAAWLAGEGKVPEYYH